MEIKTTQRNISENNNNNLNKKCILWIKHSGNYIHRTVNENAYIGSHAHNIHYNLSLYT